jgi:Nucleotidyltransferase of unknown function (DUF6036)
MGNKDVFDFLRAIDAGLLKHAEPGETAVLYLLGRSAMIVCCGLDLMTKDVDIVHDTSRLQKKALETFGEGTVAANILGLYLESVSSGLPPLPSGYQARCVDIPGPWEVIRPKRLEANDLAVTKLKRFAAKDREDLRILCDSELLDASTLRERLESAFMWAAKDDDQRDAARANAEIVIEYLEGRRRTI